MRLAPLRFRRVLSRADIGRRFRSRVPNPSGANRSRGLLTRSKTFRAPPAPLRSPLRGDFVTAIDSDVRTCVRRRGCGRSELGELLLESVTDSPLNLREARRIGRESGSSHRRQLDASVRETAFSEMSLDASSGRGAATFTLPSFPADVAR